MASQLDFERCYRAVESADARFDGWFITAVTTTGIYCRPSCPTPVRPRRANVRFYPTAAAAQLAGFRACKRCRPDASPGSPEWNVRGDLVGRAIPVIAEARGGVYRRTLRLPRGAGIATLEPVEAHIRCTLRLESMADLASAVRQCRRLLDLDADPLSVLEVLTRDRHLSPIVKKRPGLRAPGAVEGTELAVQAILGQQVSLAAGRTLALRLVTAHGDVIKIADPTLTHLFPRAEAIAAGDLSRLGVPATRRQTLRTLARAVAAGDLALDPGADRVEVHRKLTATPGIGEWTAGYIVMRALGDPDTFLPDDLGIKKAGAQLGLADARALIEHSAAWRPWRTYATHQLWATLADQERTAKGVQ